MVHVQRVLWTVPFEQPLAIAAQFQGRSQHGHAGDGDPELDEASLEELGYESIPEGSSAQLQPNGTWVLVLAAEPKIRKTREQRSAEHSADLAVDPVRCRANFESHDFDVTYARCRGCDCRIHHGHEGMCA